MHFLYHFSNIRHTKGKIQHNKKPYHGVATWQGDNKQLTNKYENKNMLLYVLYLAKRKALLALLDTIVAVV